jgi:hypothetical protein
VRAYAGRLPIQITASWQKVTSKYRHKDPTLAATVDFYAPNCNGFPTRQWAACAVLDEVAVRDPRAKNYTGNVYGHAFCETVGRQRLHQSLYPKG